LFSILYAYNWFIAFIGVLEQLPWVLGAETSNRKDREDSAGEGALGISVSGIRGCLVRHFFSQ
jgi:hypothetical protein